MIKPAVTGQPVIELTAHAAEYLQKCLAQKDACGLRVGVRKSGCSGLSYDFEYVKTPPQNAWHGIVSGVPVWIDHAHVYALSGIRLDYVKQGLNYVLQPYNPNAQNACGCGESFNVDPA